MTSSKSSAIAGETAAAAQATALAQKQPAARAIELRN
jgi:hypothetical protein